MLSWLVTIKNTSDIPHFEKFRVSTPIAEHAEDEYTIACLLFVFVAVSVPKLARSELSVYKASLEGKWLGAYCSQKQRVTAGCSWIWVSLASVKYEVQKVEGTWLCFRVEANTLNRHIPLSPPPKKERFTVRRTWSWAQNTKVRTKGNNFIDNLLSTSAVLSLATEKQKMKKISGVNINVKVFENVKIFVYSFRINVLQVTSTMLTAWPSLSMLLLGHCSHCMGLETLRLDYRSF